MRDFVNNVRYVHTFGYVLFVMCSIFLLLTGIRLLRASYRPGFFIRAWVCALGINIAFGMYLLLWRS